MACYADANFARVVQRIGQQPSKLYTGFDSSASTMVFHLPPRQTLGILGIAGLVILTITLVNPVSNFNALLFLIYLLVIGHLVLQENSYRFSLAFVRPLITGAT